MGETVDQYLAELDRLIAQYDYVRDDVVVAAIGAGRVSHHLVRRVALERYYVAKWMTPELGLLIANAPDGYAFTMEDSTHYQRWVRRFAAATGYGHEANHLEAAVALCRQLGASDAEVAGYEPLAETIAMTCTTLYYVRRSYEEGLAVLGFVGERLASGAAEHARTLTEGLRTHYGVTLDAAPAAVEPAGAAAVDLFRQLADSQAVRSRCRLAIRNHVLTATARVRAMNRWVT